MNNPLTPLAQVVTVALNDAGLSENTTAKRTGIPRSTLRRRLMTGDFHYETELWPVARLLSTTPSALVALAEDAA